jgi:hypothetical protein
VYLSGPPVQGLQTAHLLDRDAGRALPKPGDILCGRGGVLGLGHWHLGVWHHHNVVVFGHHVVALCHRNPFLGEFGYRHQSLNQSNIHLLSLSDHPPRRLHRHQSIVVLRVRLLLQLGVRVLHEPAVQLLGDPHGHVRRQVLPDHCVDGRVGAAATVHVPGD